MYIINQLGGNDKKLLVLVFGDKIFISVIDERYHGNAILIGSLMPSLLRSHY